MNKKIKVAIIGCGRFARNFVKLFKHHPYVEKVYVSDIRKDREEEYATTFEVDRIESFEKNAPKSAVVQDVICKEKRVRKITEIRIFFDDNTYETFSPSK